MKVRCVECPGQKGVEVSRPDVPRICATEGSREESVDRVGILDGLEGVEGVCQEVMCVFEPWSLWGGQAAQAGYQPAASVGVVE